MTYRVEYSKRAGKQFKKMDPYTRVMLLNWISKNLMNCTDPRAYGKAIKGNLENQWRIRIGNARICCEIMEERLIILVINTGHKKEIYE